MTDESAGGLGPASLLRLMTWLSPAFPVGAFAFSHGLECAVAEGRVPDGEALFGWLRTLIVHGSGWNDLVLFREAFDAESLGQMARLDEVRELALALGGTRERREETLALGDAFAAAAMPWRDRASAGEPSPYPVAVAIVAAANLVPLKAALTAYAHGFASSLVGAATRLVPLGQSEAVRVLRRLEPVVLDASSRAAVSTLDDLGSAAFLADISAMRHETMQTRLFRS